LETRGKTSWNFATKGLGCSLFSSICEQKLQDFQKEEIKTQLVNVAYRDFYVTYKPIIAKSKQFRRAN